MPGSIKRALIAKRPDTTADDQPADEVAFEPSGALQASSDEPGHRRLPGPGIPVTTWQSDVSLVIMSESCQRAWRSAIAFSRRTLWPDSAPGQAVSLELADVSAPEPPTAFLNSPSRVADLVGPTLRNHDLWAYGWPAHAINTRHLLGGLALPMSYTPTGERLGALEN
ncbi:hypothetical protein GCM10022419_119110 [Nonomuraea rosea]|uniref:Uncharacterized protein n=1 Tax=Nonomuraea rosea TaxID=638574 RepID=A0ABP6ZM20_9ACTN